VQGLPSPQESGTPGWQVPAASQVSAPLQTFPSVQARPATGLCWQCAWHVPAEMSAVSKHTLSGVHEVGQAPGIPSGIAMSQSSPLSIEPFPQPGEQSGSVAAVAPDGQHMSAGPMVVMMVCEHCAWHVPAPLKVSTVQGSPSSQLVGQAPLEPALAAMSHVSPGSTWPLPQTEGQSLSTAKEAPDTAGQHPSLLTNAVMVVVWQCASQLPAPTSDTVWHAFADGTQLCGQAPAWPCAMPVSQSSPAD
jgi:hypothetical protein